MRRFNLLFSVLLSAVLVACAPPANQGGFSSDNPESQLFAITRAGEDRNPAAIPQLVAKLDSDDPAVRMLAIVALERITGARLGYNPYDSGEDRQPAIDRWTAVARSGRLPAQTQPATGPSGH